MKASKCLMMLILSFAIFMQVLSAPVHAQPPQVIRIYMDGLPVQSDVAPYIIPKANVTMVPLRVISENLGAVVDWTPQTKSVTIRDSGTTIIMTLGQNKVSVNGLLTALGNSVQSRQGRTMVPLRFVSEQLGLQVIWNQAVQTISLVTGNLPVPPDGAPLDDGSLKGAWVSSVFNLDWPSKASNGNQAMQQQDYVKLLDDLQGMGMNAVFVQIRPAADALYPSALVPWSKVLTGVQGEDPGYDPLAFMIGETHKRGMQFHAWFNPFRANTDTNTQSLAPNHVAKLHPEWIVNANKVSYINPGIPEARQHIIDAIMEVVNHYDIDGVHLDDYFYPLTGTFDDETAFLNNNAGKLTKADWRRNNINEFVFQLSGAIHSVKPGIQFGISPPGVWRNKSQDPTGSDTAASVTAYDNAYADVRTWIQQDYIDYVIPQIYWSMSFSAARYDKLVDWWAGEVAGTNVKLYIGHSPYKLGTKEAGWQNAQEIINQLRYNALHSEVKGDVFFSAKDLRRNPLGIAEALRAYYGM